MRLVAMSGGQTLSFPLRQGSTIIGRHSSCHICIPSKAISRRHCQCYVDGNTASLRDLDSSHGTFVNGQHVERADLHDGDVISLGGLQLRFEMGEAGGGAYAQGARPAEDIVVVAQAKPADGAAPGPATPFPDEPLPPPAPTDFPEAPNGEETPVDGSFVPAPYTGGQSAAVGPALQPQLFVRDGRWYLRDPRTGREIEIAPKGAEGLPAVRPEGAEARRPNVRLLVAVVVAAVVAILVFASVVLKQKPIVNGGPRYSIAAYNAKVDDAIADIQAAKYADATTKLEAATKMRPDIEVARLLAQYVGLRQAAGDDLEKLNWSEARRYLESILNARNTSDKTIAFANERLAWLDKEQVALGLRQEALQRLKGESNEEILLEVRQALLQLPADTYAARLTKADIAALDKRLGDLHIARAENASKAFRWDVAHRELAAALPIVADKSALQKKIADCQRFETESKLLEQAKEEMKNSNFDSARRLLKQIKSPGPYYDEAQSLLARIDDLERSKQLDAIEQSVLTNYKNGAGEKAIELIEKHKLAKFAYIKERVHRIEQLLAEGDRAEKEKRYEDAEAAYQAAVDVEPDAENDYHRRSKALLDAIVARHPQIAAEFASDGNKKLVTGDPIGARKCFDRALKFDDKNERAPRGLESLDSAARFALNEGFRFETEGKFAHAREQYRKACDCAAPGSELQNRALQALERIKDK